MFHSIKRTLEQRKDELRTQSSVSVLVKQAVQSYIRENYPEVVSAVTVRYDTAERLVVITTPSKVLAGELMLNSREIRGHLTAHNIRVNRIVAR